MKKHLLTSLSAAATLLCAVTLPIQAFAADKITVGVMLPFSGTLAPLGEAIENGFKLYAEERGGKIAGKEIVYVRLDDEADPAKALDNVNKLIKRDKVDVLLGSVHSGVATVMAKVTKDTGTLLMIPHAGTDAITGRMCASNIFRSSFSNSQVSYGTGKMAATKGYKRVVTVAWKFSAGDESVKGFKDGLAGTNTKVVSDLTLPFPNVEFQAILTQISALKPDAVFAFFGGMASVKFVKEFNASGLNKTTALIGPGFLTEGMLEPMGKEGEGILTGMHYGDGMETARNKAFRLAYAKTFKSQPDVYAVQGYDAGQMLFKGLEAVKGDISKGKEISEAIRHMTVDSPRGPFKLSKAHSPVQDIYARVVSGKENKITGVAAKAVDGPSQGCEMAN